MFGLLDDQGESVGSLDSAGDALHDVVPDIERVVDCNDLEISGPCVSDDCIGVEDSGGIGLIQEGDFTCAVVAQEMILKDFGIDLSEIHLSTEAASHGWLTTDGTPLEHVGELLNLHGVPCHQGNGIDGMVQELAAGHKVIVGVDAHELWGDGGIPDFLAETPNHAVVIQGVKMDSDGEWVAVLNDPGDPNGAGVEYPLDQFIDAAADSQFQFTATDFAPPHLEDHPVFGAGFDSQTQQYDGLLDWTYEHSDALGFALGVGAGVAVGGLVMPLAPSSSGIEGMTQKQRDEILRRL